jgi:hypothetical protein
MSFHAADDLVRSDRFELYILVCVCWDIASGAPGLNTEYAYLLRGCPSLLYVLTAI